MLLSPRRILILVLCLALRFHGSAEASGFRYQFLPDPASGLEPLEVQATDGALPDGWRFYPPDPDGNLPTGRGNMDVTLDPVTGRVLESYREGDVEVRTPLVLTPEQYNEILTGRTFHKLWSTKSRANRSVARNAPGMSGPGFRFEAPVELPSLVRKIVGDGAPAIEISGSETITLSGSSDWTVSDYIQTERQRQSAFPSLEMKQELNVNLTGSIGDKIKVDVDQSSNVATTLDNKVKLRYEGGDDDMIRSVELGNTNLSVEGASFRQEGLFGVKTVAKLGNVDVQTIASKQEGKSETARFTPSGELKREIVYDLQYIPRTYFLIASAPLQIDYSTLKVWRDDGIYTNNESNGARAGYARLDPSAPSDSTNPQIQSRFDLLQLNVDYDIRDDFWITGTNKKIPVLVMRRQLATTEVLGVTYTYTDSISGQPVPVGTDQGDSVVAKAIKVRSNDLVLGANGLYDPAHPWFQTLLYELRNFYDIRGRDISMETLTLRVRRIQAGESADPAEDTAGKEYIEILGLDERSKAGSANLNAPDGTIDDQFINPETGIVWFPDVHPFAPDDSTFLDWAEGGRYAPVTDRNTLDTTAVALANGVPANPNVYYSPNPNLQSDIRYYIEAEFKSSTQGFSLGRFDIMEGSEQVKVDGIPQQRGRDYNIDYTTGQITFTKPPGPNQTISVDYSYAPGFGSTQLTLLGAAASYVPGPNFSLTSSLLYDSRGAQEKRPKLGEEPAKSLIGDVASVVTFRPVWMTQFANLIPGVRTNSPSTLNIQGHAAVSSPNPNTQGEAYLDDMEGNRESVTASLSRTQWFWSSVPTFEKPLPDSLPNNLPAPVTSIQEHTLLEWYNARNVKERDLKPVLLDAEGGDNEHQVLELNIKPPTGTTTILPSNWTGVTQSISSVGQDFSKLRFLEIWVNDFHPYPSHTDVRGKLHINFGRVSEDAFWSPDTLPNNQLDTEDKNGDGKLDRSSDLAVDEDTGLDGLHSIEEPGYTGGSSDPHRDDYYFDPNRVPLDYSGINNMEENGTGDPAARPDTEDLNRDGFADFQNAYFEAVIDLADTSRFVAVDVERDYGAREASLEHPINPINGWRLYRIPINEEVFRRSSTSASWTNVQHVRLWVNGADNPLKVQIGGIELVGNRWLAAAIDSSAAERGLQLFVGSRNNKDDADIYTPPYDPENATGSTAEAREQSLALRFTGLEASDTLFAFRTSTDGGAGGLGWTQYSEIRFWSYGNPLDQLEDLRLLARFGPDTVNYYEYSAPMRPGWNKIVIPMERMSGVKETGAYDATGARFELDPTTGESFRAVGNPSFTRIVRTSFGLTRTGPAATDNSEIWINDLRLAGVKRERGMRGDLSVQANFSDVLALNVGYENQDENFVRVANNANQGTGMNHVATSVATTFQLDKLFPTTGVQLPVRLSMARATDIPKFRTGSDVTLTDSRSELESRIQNRQSVDVSYRRTGPRKGFSRYTFDAISGGMTYTRAGNQNVSSIDSSWAFEANGNYDLPLGGGGLGILGNRMRIGFLPEVIGFSVNWRSTRNLRYGRFLFADRDTDSTVIRSDVKERLLALGGNASWTPLSSVRLRFGVRSLRNMLIKPEDEFIGFNKGTEVDHSRTLELNYAPKWLGLFQPNVILNGRYHENSRPELQTLNNDPQDLKNVDNSGSARVTATVPLGRFAQLLAPAPGKGNVSYFRPVKAVLSRLQDIQASFNMERGSSISRVTGDAGFWFKTGFTEARDPELTEAVNSVFVSNRSYTSGANTTFRPTQNMTIDARADHRLSYSDGNFGARRVMARSLPDLKGRWLELQRLFGLQNTLSTMSINSGYMVRVEETGPTDGNVEIRTTTTNYQPLLGWDLAWRSGLRANISTNYINAVNVDHRLFDVTGDRQTKNTEVRFSKTFPASKGIRLPFSRNPIRLPNDLNLNLTFTSTTDRKVTIRPRSGLPDIVEIDQTRWNVSSATNYNFTQSISGGFNMAYRNTSDRKTDIQTRGITLGLNAQFRF